MKTRIFIILALLTFIMYNCSSRNDEEPLTLEAYGRADFHPGNVFMQLYEDSTAVPKEYVTSYARLGFHGETIDWSQKVYVYVRGNSVEVISNISKEEANALFLFSAEGFFRAFLASAYLWGIPLYGAAYIMVFFFGLNAYKKRKLLFCNQVLLFVMMAGGTVFCIFGAHIMPKDDLPELFRQGTVAIADVDTRQFVVLNGQNGAPESFELLCAADVATGNAFAVNDTVAVYRWGSHYMASSEILPHGKLEACRNVANSANGIFVAGYYIVCMCVAMILISLITTIKRVRFFRKMDKMLEESEKHLAEVLDKFSDERRLALFSGLMQLHENFIDDAIFLAEKMKTMTDEERQRFFRNYAAFQKKFGTVFEAGGDINKAYAEGMEALKNGRDIPDEDMPSAIQAADRANLADDAADGGSRQS